MMDVGMTVEFDGKKNVVMEGEIIKEYPICGLICEYARLHPTDLKQIILDNPYFQDSDLKENGGAALMHFYQVMQEKLGVVAASMVITDFSNLMADYNLADEETLKEFLDDANKDKDTDQVKVFILKDTGFVEFGISTIGQAMLTAYASYAYMYVAFRHTFNMVVTGDEYDEKQVMAFWGLYGDESDYQHIDYRLMFYDNAFHSLYTVKSSLSLILFEAAHAMDAGTKFVKCKNCGNYFVPIGRSDSVYCGYPSPQDETKSCRDVGANATRARKMKNDIMTQEYRRLYMRLKMGTKRHPENKDLQERFIALTEGMKVRRKQKEAGSLSTDEILEWLSSFDNSLNDR